MNETDRILLVCGIKDELTGRFLQPTYFESEEEAIRWFKFVLNKNDMMSNNAAMYSLYRLASFGEKSGYSMNTEMPYMIQGGMSVLERTKND